MEGDHHKLPAELLNYVAMLAGYTPGSKEATLGKDGQAALGQENRPTSDAMAKLEIIAASVTSAMQQQVPINQEVFNLLLEQLSFWQTQNHQLAVRCLHLIDSAAAHMRKTGQNACGLVQDIAIRLLRVQTDFHSISLRASCFQTFQSLVQISEYEFSKEGLQNLFRHVFRALQDAITAEPAGSKFSLQVLSVCSLAPAMMSGANIQLPECMEDYGPLLLKTASSVIQYYHRVAGTKCEFRWDLPDVTFTDHNIYIFFGILPKILKGFARGGINAADETGDTVLHRLANSDMRHSLEIFLVSCGADLDFSVKNKAGHTPLEIAANSGFSSCLDLLRKHSAKAEGLPPMSSLTQEEVARQASSSPSKTSPGQMCETLNGSAPPPVLILPSEKPLQFDWAALGQYSEAQQLQLSDHLRLLEVQRQLEQGMNVTPLTPSEDEGARPSMSNVQSQRSSVEVQPDLQDERSRVEQALAKLSMGSTDSSRVQNPIGNLPMHQNPFASFQEGNESSIHPFSSYDRRDGSTRFNSIDNSPGRDPLQSVLGFDGGHHSPSPWEDHFKGKRDLDWETANTPSTRMWLGNIASHVTVEGLFEVFNKYGELTDGAVFPARIGPLGYAFLNFRYVEDAVRAYEALNNHCVPALSASKLLKLRFKPAQNLKMGEGSENIVTQPSKHLWLGNIPMRPDKAAIDYLFGSFGHVTSVRVFPGKTFAFVNFETAQEAEYAMKCLDGLHWPAVSGQKAMAVRFQAPPQPGRPLMDTQLRHLSLPPALQNLPNMQQEMGTLNSLSLAPYPLGSLKGRAAPPSLPGQLGLLSHQGTTNRLARRSAEIQGYPAPGQTVESLMPAVNLSNKLNPNNMHFDKHLAERYKYMSKTQKELLWQQDRTEQLQALQGQSQILSDPQNFGLAGLLNQNNNVRPSGNFWNTNSGYIPAMDAGQPVMYNGSHQQQQQLTRMEILNAISQIGWDNIPADLLQQLKSSMGEESLTNTDANLRSFIAQPQLGEPLPVSSSVSRFAYPGQDQTAYRDSYSGQYQGSLGGAKESSLDANRMRQDMLTSLGGNLSQLMPTSDPQDLIPGIQGVKDDMWRERSLSTASQTTFPMSNTATTTLQSNSVPIDSQYPEAFSSFKPVN